MAYPQAKRCLYDGTWFKSNLEGKAAESFDNLGIRWKYEPVVVRGSQFVGGQYTPDFYLPDMLCYVEVAGAWDGNHYAREIGRNLFDAAGVKRYGGR